MIVTDRIRITGGPWPERIGCEGSVVPPPPGMERTYPWGDPDPRYVIVLLDDDPLACERHGCHHDPTMDFCRCTLHDPPWSCSIGRRDVAVLAREGAA